MKTGWHNDILKENNVASVKQLQQKFKNEQEILDPHYSPCTPLAEITLTQMKKPAIDLAGLFERIKNPATRIEVVIGELRDSLFPDEDDTKNHLETNLPGILAAFEERLKNEEQLDIQNNVIPVTRELVMVASDITNELKVEFPGMHGMYWGDDFSISPAKYVRASMSVPLFFKPYEVKYNTSNMLTIDREWQNLVKTPKKADPALFVDGGLLSNFPINVFYNPDMAIPRKPTFGIKLEYDKLDLSAKIKSLLSFLGSIISTMRFFYDRDFALKHDIYKKTVRSIDTGKVHWLNFNLTDQQKIELFFRGALTATIFLARHAITESDTQGLLSKGQNVNFNDTTFSIYEDSAVSFHTEDCLVSNVTFEWNHYKRERLMDRISKEKRRRQMKAGASLQKMKDGAALQNVPDISS